MASPLANFFRTAPGFSLIYGAGRRTGEVVSEAGRVTGERTGIRPGIPEPSERPTNPVREKSTEMGFYETMRGAGEWWNKNIETPFERFGPAGHFAAGVLGAPRTWVMEPAGMIPAGGMRLFAEMRRDPTSFLGFAAAGLTLQGAGMVESATKDPARFAGSMLGGALLMEGMSRGGRVGYEAISPRLTEASILLRTSPKTWRATHSTVNLFKDVYKIESRLGAEPDLSLVRNIGDRGPAITDFISKQQHAIFGRTTEIGQMPRGEFWARGGTKDIDIFTTNIKDFQAGAVKTLGRDFTTEGNLIVREAGGTALDIHSFPERYPIGESLP